MFYWNQGEVWIFVHKYTWNAMNMTYVATIFQTATILGLLKQCINQFWQSYLVKLSRFQLFYLLLYFLFVKSGIDSSIAKQ